LILYTGILHEVKCGSRLYNTVGNILALFVRNLLKIRVRDYELLVSDESDDLVRSWRWLKCFGWHRWNVELVTQVSALVILQYLH